MKNNILIYFICIFIFTFFYNNKVISQELQINANEIQSLEKGQKIIAINGVEIKDPKGIIINADKARTCFILKRSMASGFAGIDNPLFFNDNSYMIFGDAKTTVEGLVGEFKEAAI